MIRKVLKNRKGEIKLSAGHFLAIKKAILVFIV